MESRFACVGVAVPVGAEPLQSPGSIGDFGRGERMGAAAGPVAGGADLGGSARNLRPPPDVLFGVQPTPLGAVSCLTDAETARNAAARLAYFSEALAGGTDAVIGADP